MVVVVLVVLVVLMLLLTGQYKLFFSMCSQCRWCVNVLNATGKDVRQSKKFRTCGHESFSHGGAGRPYVNVVGVVGVVGVVDVVGVVGVVDVVNVVNVVGVVDALCGSLLIYFSLFLQVWPHPCLTPVVW